MFCCSVHNILFWLMHFNWLFCGKMSVISLNIYCLNIKLWHVNVFTAGKPQQNGWENLWPNQKCDSILNCLLFQYNLPQRGLYCYLKYSNDFGLSQSGILAFKFHFPLMQSIIIIGNNIRLKLSFKVLWS